MNTRRTKGEYDARIRRDANITTIKVCSSSIVGVYLVFFFIFTMFFLRIRALAKGRFSEASKGSQGRGWSLKGMK
jgi:hypothetical protein